MSDAIPFSWDDVISERDERVLREKVPHLFQTHGAFEFCKTVKKLFAAGNHATIYTLLGWGTAAAMKAKRSDILNEKLKLFKYLVKNQIKTASSAKAEKPEMFYEEYAFKLVELDNDLLLHSQQSKALNTIIHVVAARGSDILLRRLIDLANDLFEKSGDLSWTENFMARDKNLYTPMHYIVEEQQGETLFTMLKLLSQQVPGTELDKITLHYILEHKENGESILRHLISWNKFPVTLAQDLVDRIICTEPNISSQILDILITIPGLDLRGQDLLYKAIEYCRPDLFKQLLSSQPYLRNELNARVVERTIDFIERNDRPVGLEILDLVLQANTSTLYGRCLLHKAIAGSVVDVVEKLLTRSPELAYEEDEFSMTPMSKVAWNSTNDHIRNAVASRIMRLESRLLHEIRPNKHALDAIRELLSDSEEVSLHSTWAPEQELILETGREICLNLSMISSSASNFVRLLQRSSHNQATPELPEAHTFDVEFESTLRYVDLPVSDPHTVNGYSFSTSAQFVLHWLREYKGVSGIYELRVQDSLHCPHSEQAIKESIEGFAIEILDWRRTDMSIEPLLARTIPQSLRRLTLYASTWASLFYWTSREIQEVLRSQFTSLEIVNMVIDELLIGDRLASDYAVMAAKRVKTCGVGTTNIEMLFTHESCWHRPVDRPPNKRLTDKKSTAVEATELTAFLKAYADLHREFKEPDWRSESLGQIKTSHEPRIRVAVLDTGIDSTLFSGPPMTGASFVQTDSAESPWFLSLHSHGTHMARIISQLDPSCELLIGKIGDHVDDMTVDSVTKAIEWAIRAEVDIISLSGTLTDISESSKQRLHDVVASVASKGIVMVASTEGKGYSHNQVWPAGFDSVLGIASATIYGDEAPGSVKARADFLFPGQDIAIGEQSTYPGATQESISGTSVATAVAAGVASLVLACHRFALSRLSLRAEGETVEQWRDRTQQESKIGWMRHYMHRATNIRQIFQNMSASGSQSVKPSAFFKDDPEQKQWGGADNTLEWICKAFGELGWLVVD